jgi:hypothetical protein
LTGEVDFGIRPIDGAEQGCMDLRIWFGQFRSCWLCDGIGNWRQVEHAVDSGSVSTNASFSPQGSCESFWILIWKRDWKTLLVNFFGNTHSMDSTIDMSLTSMKDLRRLRDLKTGIDCIGYGHSMS